MRSSQARTEEHSRNVEYYEAHYSELLAQYPNQWIAILERKVVGASDDAFQLMAQLEADGVPSNQVLRRHMTKSLSFSYCRIYDPWILFFEGRRCSTPLPLLFT